MGTAVLIVEDDKALSCVIARLAIRWGDEVYQARSVREAVELLERDPVLLLVDVRLPDGSALDVVAAARRHRPTPTMVAWSGLASADEGFHLAQAGVRAYLAKPISLAELAAAVESALHAAPEIEPYAVAAVGHQSMLATQSDLRRAMVEQALARAHGNRSKAARLLDISRQAVQQIVRAPVARRQTPLAVPRSK